MSKFTLYKNHVNLTEPKSCR